MIKPKEELHDRDYEFKLYKLKWLDQEITRYRNFEWKATSFHIGFFVAILFFLIDPIKAKVLFRVKYMLAFAIIIYLGIACAQLIYIHFRLNKRRNNKSEILSCLENSTAPKKITKLRGFYEGPGVIFILGFITSLIFLAITDLYLLFDR